MSNITNSTNSITRAFTAISGSVPSLPFHPAYLVSLALGVVLLYRVVEHCNFLIQKRANTNYFKKFSRLEKKIQDREIVLHGDWTLHTYAQGVNTRLLSRKMDARHAIQHLVLQPGYTHVTKEGIDRLTGLGVIDEIYKEHFSIPLVSRKLSVRLVDNVTQQKLFERDERIAAIFQDFREALELFRLLDVSYKRIMTKRFDAAIEEKKIRNVSLNVLKEGTLAMQDENIRALECFIEVLGYANPNVLQAYFFYELLVAKFIEIAGLSTTKDGRLLKKTHKILHLQKDSAGKSLFAGISGIHEELSKRKMNDFFLVLKRLHFLVSEGAKILRMDLPFVNIHTLDVSADSRAKLRNINDRENRRHHARKQAANGVMSNISESKDDVAAAGRQESSVRNTVSRQVESGGITETYTSTAPIGRVKKGRVKKTEQKETSIERARRSIAESKASEDAADNVVARRRNYKHIGPIRFTNQIIPRLSNANRETLYRMFGVQGRSYCTDISYKKIQDLAAQIGLRCEEVYGVDQFKEVLKKFIKELKDREHPIHGNGNKGDELPVNYVEILRDAALIQYGFFPENWDPRNNSEWIARDRFVHSAIDDLLDNAEGNVEPASAAAAGGSSAAV